MARTLRFILHLLLALAVTTCSTDEDITQDGADGMRLNVLASDIGANTARVTITHNGTNRDNYIGYMVQGTVEDVQGNVRQHFAATGSQDLEKQTMSQRKKVVRLTGLQPCQTYTYIATGVDATGHACGTPAACVFTTESLQASLVLHTKWQVTIKACEFVSPEYVTMATLKADDNDSERFFLAIYPCSERREYDTEENFLDHAAKEYNKANNPQNDEFYWLSNLACGNDTAMAYLEPGEYVAYAIGMNVDGTLSGHYAHSDVAKVEAYPETEAYRQMYGTWTATDADDKTFSFSIARGAKVNRSFNVTGWGDMVWDMVMGYDPQTATPVLEPQAIASNYTTTQDGKRVTGNVTMVVWGKELKAADDDWYIFPKFQFRANSVATADGGYRFYLTSRSGLKWHEGITYYFVSDDESTKFYYTRSRLHFPLIIRRNETHKAGVISRAAECDVAPARTAQ